MTDSRYVVPTGRGYLGTHAVSTGRTVTLSTAVLGDRDWTDRARVHAIAHADGVALVPAAESTEPIAAYVLCTRHDAARIAVGSAAVAELGLEPGDSVRVYDLAVIDDRPGLLLVDAADDPCLEADGDAGVDDERDAEADGERDAEADGERDAGAEP
ncbi:hypothetical protein [Natronorubrum texcoconense]|uniref:Uncharacterized protein n=1 Tax=Natronorubrum texcoconense TaxID=1095776 RepID=A0A1G9G1X6_9EURY|nr:hypothetical protein [Natronorubrum texcoconense]SDK94636.1 hypothetical protein SAMN04515672_4385 [Natronorubrum texcoconense]